MTPERLRAIETLFHQAREQSPAERAAFLARACADDLELRREVESLLAQPPGALDGPVGALVADLMVSASPRLTPGSLLGPYRIDRLLGAGGMGEVYCATDTGLKRQVAIKVLPESVASDVDRIGKIQTRSRSPRVPESSANRADIRPGASRVDDRPRDGTGRRADAGGAPCPGRHSR